tara:strand:+ start:1793 stop:2212 length:420 start_codon:yes stop_codon:yes gene_type:complete
MKKLITIVALTLLLVTPARADNEALIIGGLLGAVLGGVMTNNDPIGIIAGGAVGATLGNSTHSTNGLPSDVSGRQQSRIYSNPSFFESRIRENHAVQTTTSVIRRTITQSQHPYLQQQRYGQTMPKYFCDTASNACYWY